MSSAARRAARSPIGVSRVAYSDADVAGRQYVIGSDARGRARAADRSGRQHLRPPRRPRIRRFRRSSSARTSTRCRAAATSTATSARSRRSASSRRCERAGVRTRHPLEIVVWSAEEGVAFGRGLAGSRIVAGDVKPADMDAVWNGLRRADGIRKHRRQPRSHHGGRPPEGRASRVSRAAHRAGRHARTRQHPDRRRRRHRRDRAVRAVVTGFAQPCGHDADGGAAGCAGRRVASDARRSRDRDDASRAGRSAPSVSSTSSPTRPTSFPASSGSRSSCAICRPTSSTGSSPTIRAAGATDRGDTHTEIEISELSRNPPALASAGGAARDRARRRSVGLSRHAPAERRRSRRADDGAARPDGHDLRPQRRRHQPLAEGTDALGGLRERRERPAPFRPGTG